MSGNERVAYAVFVDIVAETFVIDTVQCSVVQCLHTIGSWSNRNDHCFVQLLPAISTVVCR